MKFDARRMFSGAIVALILGMASAACSPTANEITGPVVTVYATPT